MENTSSVLLMRPLHDTVLAALLLTFSPRHLHE